MRAQHTVDDRLAVLGFTDLEIGRLRRGFDEVAGGVDGKQARRLADDLAAEDEAGRKLDVEGLERLGVTAMHVAQQFANVACRLEQVGGIHQRRPAIGGDDRFLQHGNQRLRNGQIAGGHQHENALARLLEHGHLAEGVDLVNAGIGARIGKEDESVVQQHSHTIGHRFSAPDFEGRSLHQACRSAKFIAGWLVAPLAPDPAGRLRQPARTWTLRSRHGACRAPGRRPDSRGPRPGGKGGHRQSAGA